MILNKKYLTTTQSTVAKTEKKGREKTKRSSPHDEKRVQHVIALEVRKCAAKTLIKCMMRSIG